MLIIEICHPLIAPAAFAVGHRVALNLADKQPAQWSLIKVARHCLLPSCVAWENFVTDFLLVLLLVVKSLLLGARMRIHTHLGLQSFGKGWRQP